MAQTNGIDKDDVMLLVGTKKGAFIISSDHSRKDWKVSGPHCDTNDVFHLVYDSRNGGTLLAAANDSFWGSQIKISHDLGQSWSAAEQNPKISDGSGLTFGRAWHIKPGRESEPGVLYLGAEPASLFRSHDWGNTWEQHGSVTRHPSRDRWEPGLGGLCMHSMVLDPRSQQKMWVGISAVGVFMTEDGGETWEPKNHGVRADFLPEPFPEFGQCPHKLLSHPAKPDTLYQQNHCGVYRSDDGGDHWHDITDGLPSRFGFVLGLHSQDPDTIYVMPEDHATTEQVGGSKRYVPDAKMIVYRSRNGGNDWEPLTNGLPQNHAYIHSMREGMATDSMDPCGIYLGTSTGQVFYSRDDGDNWELLVEYLPPINSLEIGIAS